MVVVATIIKVQVVILIHDLNNYKYLFFKDNIHMNVLNILNNA